MMNPDVFSLDSALDVAGVPYLITDAIDEAFKHSIVIIASRLDSAQLQTTTIGLLDQYVAGGGVLMATRVTDPRLFGLFGIADAETIRKHHGLTWNLSVTPLLFDWFEDPMEQTISLADESSSDRLNTVIYEKGTADVLGRYDDGTVAFTRNSVGSGIAYAVGFAFKDTLIRNQLNSDYSAQRTWSNGFEPTSDTIALLIRQLYVEAVPFGVWKYSSPKASLSTLMITHDLDSQSGMDWIQEFADYEQRNQISGTYFITTHYIVDVLSEDFYTASIPQLSGLQNLLHEVGSHSVGHFPDWGNDTVFPPGSAGNSRASYTPVYNGIETEGGTVYGELEVSKKLLVDDVGARVRSFRSGYLAWNDRQVDIMEALGYEYDSSRSANNVLTNFPYFLRHDNSFHGATSRLLEIPMTISDREFYSDTIENRVSNWLEVIGKNGLNHAPTVLLIHPNSAEKLSAEEKLIEQLDEGYHITTLAEFGDYWRARRALSFQTQEDNGSLTITLTDSEEAFDPSLALIVESAAELGSLRVEDREGREYQYLSSNLSQGRRLLYALQPRLIDAASIAMEVDTALLRLPMQLVQTPNPVDAYIQVPEGSGDQPDPTAEGGRATFSLDVSESGVFVLWGLFYTTNENNDSLYLKFDDSPPMIWDLPHETGWHWVRLEKRFERGAWVQPLSEGTHTVTIDHLEDGVRLGGMILNGDFGSIPVPPVNPKEAAAIINMLFNVLMD
ncbi:MAG: hypothetical protein GY703_15580 [Gammaproteobacteria bacterium]|nr:hypothetical protein [Gammaproteobacteria bacterium]